VPVFTNVIFDTSQVHANTLFPEMFAWLDEVKKFIQKNPETLFVIRAHPDEHRPNKESRESVRDWVKASRVDQLANVVFVDSREFISSYDLIQRSHFVMVYNSTIGLEAALLGKAVLAAGKARFTQLETAYLPVSVEEYDKKLAELLSTEKIGVSAEFQRNARRFLYYQLYGSSLPFNEYLQEDGVWPGYVMLKSFGLSALSPANSQTAAVLSQGILDGEIFEMPL
jgi:capsule polysaccharide export protein KpsC/LpsZ